MNTQQKFETKKDLLEALKVFQSEQIKAKRAALPETLSGKTMTLYHGTSSSRISSILTNGLQPKSMHGHSNYDDTNPSNEELVYLAKELSLAYAFSVVSMEKDQYEKEHDIDFNHLEVIDKEFRTAMEIYYETTGNVPVIVEVEVPVEWLYFDEDIAYSRDIFENIAKGHLKFEDLTFNVSMSQHTCTSIMPIPVENIRNVEVIAYAEAENVLGEYTMYAQKYRHWINGFQVKREDLKEAYDDLMEKIADDHAGALDEIHVTNKNPQIRYSQSAVYIDM